jgi:hypothetical protein
MTAHASSITDGLKDGISLGIKGQPFQAALHVRVCSRFLLAEGLHHRCAESFKPFLPNNGSRHSMQSTGPRHSRNKQDLLFVGNGDGAQFGPKVIKAMDSIKQGAIGELTCVHHMCPQIPSRINHPKTLGSESSTPLSVSRPGEALLRIKLDLEHVCKLVNGITRFGHSFRGLQQDSPVVNIGNGFKRHVNSPNPNMKEVRETDHGQTGQSTTLRKSIA